MDDRNDPAEAAAIEERLESIRERVGETVEALAYKTDVGARTSDGIEVAKNVTAQTAGVAAIGALDLGLRAADAIGNGLAAVQEPIASIEPSSRRRILWLAAALITTIGLLTFALRRRDRVSDEEEPIEE